MYFAYHDIVQKEVEEEEICCFITCNFSLRRPRALMNSSVATMIAAPPSVFRAHSNSYANSEYNIYFL